MNCMNSRKLILPRGPVVALRYALSRAPRFHRENPTQTYPRAVTRKAPLRVMASWSTATCP